MVGTTNASVYAEMLIVFFPWVDWSLLVVGNARAYTKDRRGHRPIIIIRSLIIFISRFIVFIRPTLIIFRVTVKYHIVDEHRLSHREVEAIGWNLFNGSLEENKRL